MAELNKNVPRQQPVEVFSDDTFLTFCPSSPCYLTLLCAGGLQMSVEDLLHHIRKEACYDDDDDGEPGRTAGQQLHEYKVHVLGVEEWPGGSGRDTMIKMVQKGGERWLLLCFLSVVNGCVVESINKLVCVNVTISELTEEVSFRVGSQLKPLKTTTEVGGQARLSSL